MQEIIQQPVFINIKHQLKTLILVRFFKGPVIIYEGKER